MDPIKRLFPTEAFGQARIEANHYAAGGAIAVQLVMVETGEPLARLSVNVPGKSERLPAQCFFVKDWSENDLIVRDCAKSGWFAPRLDLEPTNCGWEIAWVWELRDVQGEGFDYDQMLEE